MVRHIVMWKHKEEFSEEEKKEHAKTIKESLEALKDKMDGIYEIKVITNLLPSGSGDADIVLNSSFESMEVLNQYQIHPEHVTVAAFIRSVLMERKCIDYYEE